MKIYQKSSKIIPKYLTEEEISLILDRAKKDRYRNYVILLTLWRTGLRVSEIVNLEKRDIKDKIIVVRQGKGSKDRLVPLDDGLGTILLGVTDRLKPKAKIFPISTRQVRNIVYKYSGEQDISPHCFRHSFSVHCLKSGMNLRSLQKILGHSNLNTTQIYLDIVGEDIIDDFKKVKW